MKVKISGILKQSGLKFTCEQTETLSAPDLVFQSPVHLKFTFTNIGHGVLAEGTVKGVLLLSCANCLQNFSYPFAFPMTEEYCALQESLSKAEKGVSLEELSIFTYDETETIDLTEAVRQAVILNLPSHPVCSPDCQGLCPVCGKRKSEGNCDCEEESSSSDLADERWSPLLGLNESFDKKK